MCSQNTLAITRCMMSNDNLLGIKGGSMWTRVLLTGLWLMMPLSCLSTFALEVVCSPKSLAPNAVYRTDARNGNTGVQPTQFIVPPGKFEVVHGVDMSEFQDAVDFETLKRCGGRFAYVRLSAGNLPENETRYRDLWKNARSVGLLIGGYHNLFLNNPTRPYSQLTSQEKIQIDDGNIDQAKKEADLFMTRLDELLSLDATSDKSTNQLGHPFLPAVLDLTWQPQARFGSVNIKAFAPGYRRAICAWIESFRSDARFRGEQVILFTKPQIYQDYEFDQLTCRASSDKWWVSVHSKTGGNAFDASASEQSEVLAMCMSKDGPGRCLFDQYSSFGGFALFDHTSAIDLDRFYGSESDLTNLMVTASKRKGVEK